LKSKVTSVVVASAQVTSRMPAPWVKAQEFELACLLAVNVQVKSPDAGTPAAVVVRGDRPPGSGIAPPASRGGRPGCFPGRERAPPRCAYRGVVAVMAVTSWATPFSERSG